MSQNWSKEASSFPNSEINKLTCQEKQMQLIYCQWDRGKTRSNMIRFKSFTITYFSEFFFGGRPRFFGDEFVDCLFGEEFFDCLFGNVCTSDFLGLPRFLPVTKYSLWSHYLLHNYTSQNQKRNSEWEQCPIIFLLKPMAFFTSLTELPLWIKIKKRDKHPYSDLVQTGHTFPTERCQPQAICRSGLLLTCYKRPFCNMQKGSNPIQFRPLYFQTMNIVI